MESHRNPSEEELMVEAPSKKSHVNNSVNDSIVMLVIRMIPRQFLVQETNKVTDCKKMGHRADIDERDAGKVLGSREGVIEG